MTLKLTNQQAVALKHLFDQAIIPELPANVADRLIKELMLQVFRKLRHKLECRIKDGYSLNINDLEGMAFYLYFQARELGPNWLYEQNLVDALLIPLDKEYA